MTQHDDTLLVAHVVHSLRTGGLENGLVNLINRMPAERYRHAVICLTDHDRFAERIERDDVPLFALNKREGKDPALYFRLWRTLRRLQPDLVHTRNLATVEAQLPAWLAGVPARIHGEHGRDMADLTGANRRYRLLRRILRPLVHHYIPLSRDLEGYLRDAIGVRPERMTRITNGVDVERFHPDARGPRNACSPLRGWPDGQPGGRAGSGAWSRSRTRSAWSRPPPACCREDPDRPARACASCWSATAPRAPRSARP
ncbi:MAG: glycosyltransferase [Halofilum sp. (in: g-proteobacteria)]|nr:glycosyltransferase [Halofilum sp. (in: g-proteobacteria)]